MVERIDPRPQTASVPAPVQSKTGSIGQPTLWHSIRFHTAIIAFLYAIGVIALLASFELVGDVSFVLLLFMSGALGGVMTTYMRLRAMPTNEEMVKNDLTNTLAIIQVYVSPAIASVFGFVLYGLFLSDMLQGSLFPKFVGTDIAFNGVVSLFTDVKPASQLDAVKSLLWAFLAGFSERLVPNILDRLATEAEASKGNPPAE